MNQRISIIVPTYNAKAYVKEAVASLCAQTYDNIEIIVVDDGSTDGTAELLRDIQLTDKRIKVVYKENEGVTKTRLRGVQEASGEWVGFMDADDTVESNMYETLLYNAEKSGADISHCGYLKVFADRTVPYYDTKKRVVQDNEQGLYDLLKGDFVEPGLWNKLYKRTLFDEILQGRIIDTTVKINEDLLMNYYLFKRSAKSIFEDKCLYRYFCRENSASTQAINVHKLCDPLKVRKILYIETLGNKRLNGVMRDNVLMRLIQLATRKISALPDWAAEYIRQARKELKEFYKIVKKQPMSKKTKWNVRLAICSPALYRIVHRVIVRKVKYETR